MSNCVVGSDGGGTPLGVVTEHSVEGYNHLAHHRDDDDFGAWVRRSSIDRVVAI